MTKGYVLSDNAGNLLSGDVRLNSRFNWVFAGNTFPYVRTLNAAYTVCSRMYWPATQVTGIEYKTGHAIVAVSGMSGDLRVYDATNSQVIGENLAFANLAFGIVKFDIENLPEEEAIFELQLRNNGALLYTYCSALSFEV